MPFTATCISSVVFFDVGIGDHPKAVSVILVLEGGYECNLFIFIIFFSCQILILFMETKQKKRITTREGE